MPFTCFWNKVWTYLAKNSQWKKSGKVMKLNLGITIENKLKFDKHIANISFTANQNLRVLSILASLLTFDKNRVLYKAVFESQFKYCPLNWMFCSRSGNSRINKLHERALTLIYDNDETFVLELLEMYKIKHSLSENFLKDPFFIVNSNFNLCSQSDFRFPIFYWFQFDYVFSISNMKKSSKSLRNICVSYLFKVKIRR